jgi:RNA polymerase sigma-70 factor (ECF subfamily)
LAAREDRDRQLAALIEAIARGESPALEKLYGETLGRVYGLALRIVRRREIAEEVVVDVYLQVWRTAARFDPLRGSPLAWLLTICRSRALDGLRREDPALVHPEPEVLGTRGGEERGDDPRDLLAACEGSERLERALASLGGLQRQLIALAFFRGLTHREIAAQSRLPLGSVKTYIRRALAQLRAELGTTH